MEVALAGAVVRAVVGAVTKNVVAQAFKLADKRRELWEDFPEDMENIQIELLMIAAAEEDRLKGKGDPNAVSRVSLEKMRDLAHDIEDCLDRILRHTEEGKKEASLDLANQVKNLIKRLRAAHQREIDYNVHGTAQLSATVLSQWCSPPSSVGIDEPRDQIVELLNNNAEGQSRKPMVISIVGFGGSGKTTLAKEVYHCKLLEDQFPCRAWVVASKHRDNTMSLLTELFGKFCPEVQQVGEDVEQLRTKISNYLSDKRYLIVLDDVKEQNLWHSVEYTLSNNTRSGIIVTTTIQTVAEVCSRGNGYVHNMKTLDDKHSKELLKSVLPEHSSWLEQSSSASIVKKCDGHPLSLDTVARYLKSKRVINERVCLTLSRSLGRHVEMEDVFLRLRQVLMNNYKSLPGNLPNIKACLMYMCVFPNGCHIKRTRLMRRWLAEHYVRHEDPHTSQDLAGDYFEKLVDQNIISPIGASKNTGIKSCRAHGIMHEFMLHMSQSAKFITSLDDPDRRNYRHLFIRQGRLSTSSGRSSTQGSKKKKKEKEENKLRAHSLTICGNAGEAVGEFLNCELLRVLDLEECDDLKDEDIDGIHDLWHLKYLSLGATISRLPREIQKLYCLETLDVRKTKKQITLPVVVIKLPHLAHLLGKFKLEKDWKKSKATKYAEESNLQTLAGFVTDDKPGFPTLMAGMKKLQKVKAWCNSDSEELLDAIKKFVQIGIDTCDGDYSLSLYLGENLTNDFLSSLESSLNGYLRSLKIRGALGALDRPTQLTKSLLGLTVLCLSSTNDLTINDDELSNIGRLKCLEYLKLVKVSLKDLVIRRRHFPLLTCLCLVQTPALPTVEDGALQNLVSLQLLIEDLCAPCRVNIEQYKLLQEVALDSKVNEETKTFWEDAAKKHPKRPRVLYLDRVDPDGTGSIVKYVATKRPAAQKHPKRPRVLSLDGVDPDEMRSPAKYVAPKRPASETRSSIVQEEQQIPVESVVSSAELCSSMDIDMPSS